MKDTRAVVKGMILTAGICSFEFSHIDQSNDADDTGTMMLSLRKQKECGC